MRKPDWDPALTNFPGDKKKEWLFFGQREVTMGVGDHEHTMGYLLAYVKSNEVAIAYASFKTDTWTLLATLAVEPNVNAAWLIKNTFNILQHDTDERLKHIEQLAQDGKIPHVWMHQDTGG